MCCICYMVITLTCIRLYHRMYALQFLLECVPCIDRNRLVWHDLRHPTVYSLVSSLCKWCPVRANVLAPRWFRSSKSCGNDKNRDSIKIRSEKWKMEVSQTNDVIVACHFICLRNRKLLSKLPHLIDVEDYIVILHSLTLAHSINEYESTSNEIFYTRV